MPMSRPRAAREALEHVACESRRGQADAEHGEHEQLRGAERQHQRLGDRDGEGQAHRAQHAADHRGEEAQRERPRGLPFLAMA